MKILIASDLHGSAKWCEILLSYFEKSGAKKILLLGDVLYHGPRNDLPEVYDTKRCFAMLNAMKDKIMCIRGNCDCEVDQMVLEFPIMAKNALLDLDGITAYATHGHEYWIDNMPPLTEGSVLLYGHYHVPLCTQKDGVIVMNPGSVSLPKDGSPHSAILYEDRTFTWVDLAAEEAFKTYTYGEPVEE